MSERLRSKERKNVYADTSPQQQPQFVYIELPVNKEDTLVLISMKFGVAIPELKRINSLQNERDIYALNVIKIPIKPNSTFYHQYSNQLKYGDLNMTRLSNRLDSSIERELANNKILNDYDSDDLTQVVGETENGQQILETQFIDLENDDPSTALLLNQDIASRPKPNQQTKDAKKFFKKLDNNLENLINQNKELVQKTNGEQMIPIANLSYSVENSINISSSNNKFFSSSNFFNTPDILFIAVFFMILLPIVIVIYGYYFYESGHHLPH